MACSGQDRGGVYALSQIKMEGGVGGVLVMRLMPVQAVIDGLVDRWIDWLMDDDRDTDIQTRLTC